MSVVQSDLEECDPTPSVEGREFGCDERAADRGARPDIRRQTDGDVVRFAAKGDQDAWTEVVNRFGGLVQGIARRAGLGESDAHDVAQLTWVRLWRSLDKVRDPDHVAGWLATTARRESIRFAIGRSRQVLSADPTLEYEGHKGSHPGADCRLLGHEYDPVLERALDRLPTQYRRLLQLLMSNAGLTYAEIARSLGVPVGSIGPMRLRSLQLLRSMPEVASRGRGGIGSASAAQVA